MLCAIKASSATWVPNCEITVEDFANLGAVLLPTPPLPWHAWHVEANNLLPALTLPGCTTELELLDLLPLLLLVLLPMLLLVSLLVPPIIPFLAFLSTVLPTFLVSDIAFFALSLM